MPSNTGRRTAMTIVKWVAASTGYLLAVAIPSQSAAMTSDALRQQGAKLRADIAAEYKRLKSTQTLSNRVHQDNDVTAVVVQYIPVGTSFDDAKAILRAAGCLVGVSPDGHAFGRAAMKDGLLDVKHTFSVDLAPAPAPANATVDAVRGTIFTTYIVRDIK